VLVTSNLPFDEWTSVLGAERLTGALLDRLTHHVRGVAATLLGHSERVNKKYYNHAHALEAARLYHRMYWHCVMS
jgi:DNA replication protein DnaC